MNAETIHRIAAPFIAAVDSVADDDDAIRLLCRMSEALVRPTVDLIFLKLCTEEGWTPARAQELKDAAFDLHMRIIVETVHAGGGTVEMAEQVVQATAGAFAARLAELAARTAPGSRS